MKFPRIIVSLIVAATLFASAVARAELLPGDIVGPVSVKLDGGKDIDLGKIGKTYVLAFFIPGGDKDKKQLQDLQKLLAGKEFAGVESYAITRGLDAEEQSKARAFLKEAKVNSKLLFEGKSLPAAKKFGARYFPSFYIVDKKGVVKLAAMDVKAPVRKFTFGEILAKVSKDQAIPYVDLLPISDHEKETRGMLGKAAPDFAMQDLNKKNRSLSSIKGKKNALVVYWSPQCPHCLRELPQLQQYYLSRRFDNEFEIFAITSTGTEESRKALTDVMSREMFTFPVIVDKEGTTAGKYKVGGVPCVFFVDKKGVIKEILVGETKNMTAAYNSIFNDPERLGPAKK